MKMLKTDLCHQDLRASLNNFILLSVVMYNDAAKQKALYTEHKEQKLMIKDYYEINDYNFIKILEKVRSYTFKIDLS